MKPAYLLPVARNIQHLIPGIKINQSHRDRITLSAPTGDVVLSGSGDRLEIHVAPSLFSLCAAIQNRMINIDLTLDTCEDISEPCSAVFAEREINSGQNGNMCLIYKPIITRNKAPNLYSVK